MNHFSVVMVALALVVFKNSIGLSAIAPEEERRRMKSLVLWEGERHFLTCPDGKLIRVKTAQYRLMGDKVCPKGVSTCRNTCPGSFVSRTLAKRCDLTSKCPVAARTAASRDTCSQDAEPLCILYTCNDPEQAKDLGNQAETYMEILGSAMCSIELFTRFCEY